MHLRQALRRARPRRASRLCGARFCLPEPGKFVGAVGCSATCTATAGSQASSVGPVQVVPHRWRSTRPWCSVWVRMAIPGVGLRVPGRDELTTYVLACRRVSRPRANAPRTSYPGVGRGGHQHSFATTALRIAKNSRFLGTVRIRLAQTSSSARKRNRHRPVLKLTPTLVLTEVPPLVPAKLAKHRDKMHQETTCYSAARRYSAAVIRKRNAARNSRLTRGPSFPCEL